MSSVVSKKVFLSYRRSVSSYIARSIFQDLRYRGYDVFMDVESIDSGSFESVILNQIAARAHFLVILAPGSVERFSEPGDWMRREIEEAIRLERNIVPIFIYNFHFDEITGKYLTGPLERLKVYNGINLLHEYFDAGMDKLVERFLRKATYVDLKPTPLTEIGAVQHKIKEVVRKDEPTKRELTAEEFVNRGYQEAEQGNYVTAIAAYNRAIELYPQYAHAYHVRGIAYIQMGEYALAIGDFSRAIQLDPQHAHAYVGRGLAYSYLGEYTHAIRDLDQGIDLDPQFVHAYYTRGAAYDAMGDYSEAIRDYSRAIELNPQDAHAYYTRGLVYNRLDEYTQAFRDYDRALALDPSALVYYTRGLAYSYLGEYTRAVRDFDRAIELNPQHVEAYEKRGRAYEQMGEISKARADMQKAREIEARMG